MAFVIINTILYDTIIYDFKTGSIFYFSTIPTCLIKVSPNALLNATIYVIIKKLSGWATTAKQECCNQRITQQSSSDVDVSVGTF